MRVTGRIAGLLLLVVGLNLMTASPAAAQNSVACSDFGGVLDGFAGDIPPSQIQIDQNCTIRNFPASNPLDTNFSFYTQPGQNQERWLIIFDNVVHTGQMSCNSVLEHKIWFTNGSSTTIQEGCQNLLIPVEKIDKANPAGQTTATVGVPFTYRLTMPVLYDSGTGTVINNFGSLNDLHGITLWDDLNETGADLSYVSHSIYWLDDGTPVPHTFSNVGGLLTFDNFPVVPAGEQIVVELTVVLDNSPANVNGTQFYNTAKWDFGRLIDGIFYEPLPGEWGITPPMTIAGPDLTVTKTGPPFLNLGESGDFVLDVGNAGDSDAWNVTLLDELPNINGASGGGMCDATPVITSARVFAADGVTPVPGKGPLVAGTDYSVSFAGSPSCELTVTILSAAGTIGPGERLILHYATQLDADTTNGIALTNVAGAVQWFNGDPSVAGRQTYTRTLSDGTPGTLDHEDAHTVTAALFGSYFNKTVTNLTAGGGVPVSASPGDRLRYTLRLRTTDSPLTDIRLFDDLGALNPDPVFAAGTLAIDATTLPPGADIANSDPNGGTNGSGLVDIRNFDMAADSEVVIEYEVVLDPVLANGSYAINQASLTAAGAISGLSDDPTVNGQASPDIDGDEDPTRVLIVSAPEFDVDKVSAYLDGDPTRLMAGERLRYTISVTNTGTDDAVDAMLRDQVPANTSYVAGSTTLNGVAVPDPSPGVSPLSAGIAISTPADPSPGSMPAGISATATIVFDVLVDADVVDGTIISNQAFVDAVTGGVANQPSDDPRTSVVDDPTRDVVGNLPLIYAEKSAALEVDFGTPGVVDPGDTLRYTITVYNNGAVPATEAVLTDAVPANTTYVADSTTLNGIALGADAGVSPLIAGLPVSSSDLTPPLPGPGEGTLSPGGSATLQFDLLVDAGVAPGTLIVNQALVTTAELPAVPTDGDGNPATGPEPTVVVVGPSQQLSITKQVAVIGGGPALPGSIVEYTVRVVNIGTVPASYVTIYDDLDMPVAGQLSYIPGSATMNGTANGVVFAGSLLTADYSAEYGALDPAAEVLLRFQAEIDGALPVGTVVTNTAEVTWNDPPQTATASVSVTLGGMPGTGVLSGKVWHDADFDDQFDSVERVLEGWTVDLYRADELVHSTSTDVDGNFRIAGVAPTYRVEDRYLLRFSAPGAGPNTGALGRAFSADFTNGLQFIADIAVQSGSNLADLNLPIDPNGVVYNAVGRSPLAGAIVTMFDAASGTALPAACFEDEAQQGQVTLADGYYKFDIDFSEPACPEGNAYLIEVTPPSAAFLPGPSAIIAPVSSRTTAPLSVPDCLQGGAADAIPASTNFCEATASEFAPPASAASGSAATAYHLHLILDNSNNPGSRQIFNNHIPLDPDLSDSVSITKSTPALSVTRGELVPYVITVTNDVGFDLTEVDIVDRFPAGFKYVAGSARIDSVPTEPAVVGQELVWSNLAFTGAGQHRIDLLMAVGAAVGEGDFVNRAQVVHGVTGEAMSTEATATVRLVPDPDFDCTDVMGKVYDDANRNGQQDPGEPGVPGVRLVTPTGLSATTDSYGRYHITCAIVPNENRGSNFVLKLDDRTLPSGFRASTQQIRIARATRGKTLRMNFGASIHRVIGLDLADPIFEPDTAELRSQWEPRIVLLLDQLQVAPATLRLTYLADVEDPRLVRQRLDAMESRIQTLWAEQGCCYELEIEAEVFWRLGGPPDRPVRLGEARE